VVETVEIDASPEKVWEVIRNFQDMGWHPAVTKTEGSGSNEADATRVLTLDSGGTISEKLTKYDADKKMYKYEITDVDVKVLPPRRKISPWPAVRPATDFCTPTPAAKPRKIPKIARCYWNNGRRNSRGFVA
jgi:hypothetical protein